MSKRINIIIQKFCHPFLGLPCSEKLTGGEPVAAARASLRNYTPSRVVNNFILTSSYLRLKIRESFFGTLSNTVPVKSFPFLERG